jgi:Tol biopolymer transport system component
VPGMRTDSYRAIQLSPDDTRLAVDAGRPSDVSIHDFKRRSSSKVTIDPGDDVHPIWTRDALRLVFASNRSGHWELYSQLADGTGVAQRLFRRDPERRGQVQPDDWADTGTKLLFTDFNVGLDADINLFSIGDEAPTPLAASAVSEGGAMISPNGKWIAYHSSFEQTWEVYVERFPELGDRQKVSRDGGWAPQWASSGDELYYLSADGRQMWAVPVVAGAEFSASSPRLVFKGNYPSPGVGVRPYDVTTDRRFVLIKPEVAPPKEAAREIVVIENWFQELRRLAPLR